MEPPDRSEPASPGDRLSDVLATLARAMFEAETVDQVLQAVVEQATLAVASCDGAAVMVVGQRGAIVAAASDDEVRGVEQAEADMDEGPCLQALRTFGVVVVDDLATDQRWPAWRAAATGHGYRSLLGYRLYAGATSFGALDLYSRRPHAFGDDARAAGLALAAHAALALANMLHELADAGRITGLQNALASRDLIGQAKGILMERHRVTAETAFDRLRIASQRSNRPLREVADAVVRTGDLPA